MALPAAEALEENRLDALQRQLESVRAELREKLELLEQELQALRAGSGARGGSADSCGSHAEKVTQAVGETNDPDDPPVQMIQRATIHRLTPVTPAGLDTRAAYSFKESLWDVMLFWSAGHLGAVVKIVMALIWLFNLVFQVSFITFVALHFTDTDMDDTALDSLLRYRAGAAHHVSYADTVTRRSLAAQVCDTEKKLHMAGKQLSLRDSLENLLGGGGSVLTMLAIFIWLINVFGDMSETVAFARACFHVRRGQRTEVVFQESNEEFDSEAENASKDSKEYQVRGFEAIQLSQIGRMRLRVVMAFVVVPRFLIAISLGTVGVMWLAKTGKLTDLVLNAVALSFVLDIDDLLYSAFMPPRAQTLIQNLEPLPKGKVKGKWEGVEDLAKIVTSCSVIVFIYLFVLSPFIDRLEQGNDLLCSGSQDFVWALNGATGIPHASKTSSYDAWSVEELAVLQAAHPTINPNLGWKPDPVALTAINSDFTMLVIEPEAPSIAEAAYKASAFDYIGYLNTWSTYEAAQFLSCRDLSAGHSDEATLVYLQTIMGDPNIASCDDIPMIECSKMERSALRAICPQHCRCDNVNLNTAGIFRTPYYGCPEQCNTFRATDNEIFFRLKMASYSPLQCADIENAEFAFNSDCSSTDFPALDNVMDSCKGWYDTPLQIKAYCEDYDATYSDDDFSVLDMCCGCGGGTTNVSTSAACWEDFTDDCWNMPHLAISWILYLKGLFEVLVARVGFEKSLWNFLGSGMLGVNSTDKDAFVDHVLSTGLGASWANATWELFPGVAHPRGLTGCEFLVSYEVKGLLNVDLCDSKTYSSLASFCPVSCGCSQDSSLSDCPAACVLDECAQGFYHPIHGGDGSIWSYFGYVDYYCFWDSPPPTCQSGFANYSAQLEFECLEYYYDSE